MSDRKSSSYWQEQIKSGIIFQQKIAGSDSWSRFREYYRNNFDAGELPLNMVFSHIRALIPQVYFKNPRVSVVSRKPFFFIQSQLLEKALNYIIGKIGLKKTLKKMVLDASICGISTGILGYDSMYGYDRTLIDPRVKGSGTLSSFDSSGNKIEYNQNVSPGMPFFLKARPEDVIFPYGCHSAEDAEWCAIRYIRKLDDIKKDKKYSNTSSISGDFQIKHSSLPSVQSILSVKTQDEISEKYVEIWEIRDYKTGTVKAITMESPKLLRNDYDNLQITGLPVKTLVFNDDPEWVYGISDIKVLEPQQLELNEIRKQMQVHRKLSVLKLLYEKGSLNQSDIDKILSGEMLAVGVETNGESIIDKIKDLNHQIPQDLYLQSNLLEKDIRTMLGANRNQSGEFQGKTHITKAEVESVSTNSFIRVDERRDAVADLLTEVCTDIAKMIFSYWDEPMVFDIIGPDGAKIWVNFTGSQLIGDYDFRIDANEARSVSPETRKQDVIAMMNVWAQTFSQMGITPPQELLKYFFNQFEGIDMESLINQLIQQQQQINRQTAMGAGTQQNPANLASIIGAA